ncbi:MAG: TlpA disulfide reductase family protein [Chitinophagaceae bacterium]
MYKFFVAILFVTLGISLQTGAQGRMSPFFIKGNIKGQTEGYIFLTYPGSDGKSVKDSSAIRNGNFEFKGNLTGPVMASLYGKIQSRSVGDPDYTNFFLEPKNIKINVEEKKFKTAKFSGSKLQDEYQSLSRLKSKVEEKYKTHLDSLRTEKDAEKNAAIRERLAPYFAEMDEQDYIFFDNHPKSYVTAYMLRFHVSDLTLDSLQLFYDKLGFALQQTLYGKNIHEEIEKLRGGSPGSVAKNFEAIDINDNKLSLADFKGKYVLIDFWASWCIPCRKGNPHLKELYAIYKDKGMEIIGISDDDRNHDAWKKAIEKDGLPWKHVLRGLDIQKRLSNEPNEKDINEKFGIHTLPTKILIDPSGMIIGRYGEEDEALNIKLKEVFQNN